MFRGFYRKRFVIHIRIVLRNKSPKSKIIKEGAEPDFPTCLLALMNCCTALQITELGKVV